jgi:putative transposase
MAMVHELPGTTFSNTAQRGDYDSDATACLTLAELERWQHGVTAHGAPPAIADPLAFMVDFLPVLRRRITREGIVADHIAYFCDALRPLVAACDRLGPVPVRRDPRDLSRVWVLDPEGGGMIEVSCSRPGRPCISLHEHRFAVAHLREQGRAKVDEDAIFAAVERQRDIVREAAQRTRSARKQLARTADAGRGAPPRAQPVPPIRPDQAPQAAETIDTAYDLEPYAAERW